MGGNVYKQLHKGNGGSSLLNIPLSAAHLLRTDTDRHSINVHRCAYTRWHGELASAFSREHDYILEQNRTHLKVHTEALMHEGT